MTKAQKTKLEDFIKNNNLTFTEGRRNTDSVILSGYGLFIGVKNAHDLEKVIDLVLPAAHYDYFSELRRVFQYANENAYDRWWESEIAKNTYKF